MGGLKTAMLLALLKLQISNHNIYRTTFSYASYLQDKNFSSLILLAFMHDCVSMMNFRGKNLHGVVVAIVVVVGLVVNSVVTDVVVAGVVVTTAGVVAAAVVVCCGVVVASKGVVVMAVVKYAHVQHTTVTVCPPTPFRLCMLVSSYIIHPSHCSAHN